MALLQQVQACAHNDLQFLHGYRYHDPNRQLAHCHRGLQQDQQPANDSTATLPEYSRLSRREKLGDNDVTKVAGANTIMYKTFEE